MRYIFSCKYHNKIVTGHTVTTAHSLRGLGRITIQSERGFVSGFCTEIHSGNVFKTKYWAGLKRKQEENEQSRDLT